MENIILDSINSKKGGDFTLNLKNLEGLNDLNLDIKSALEALEESIEFKNFKVGDFQINLLKKISNYGDKDVDFARINYYYHKIIFKFNNLREPKVYDSLDLFFEIKSFRSFIISLRHEGVGEFTKDYLEEVKKIQEALNINEILHNKYITEEKSPSFEEEKLLKKYFSFVKSEEVRIIEKNIEEKKEKDLNYIKSLKSDKVANALKELLSEIYNESFFKSMEFLNITINNKYTEFENYEALLEFVNKEYLVYRFNKGKSTKEKDVAIIEMGVKDYLNLPTFSREIVVNNLMLRCRSYNIIEEFFKALEEEIKEVQKLKIFDFIPVKI